MLNITRCRRPSIHESGTSTGAGRSRLRALAAIGLATALAAPAVAQDAMFIEATGMIGIGTYTPTSVLIHPRFRIEVSGTALTYTDVSTVVKTYVNGVAVNSQTIDITAGNPVGAPSGCGITCTTFQPCVCVDTPWGDVECFCGGGWVTCQPFSASLQPGDEVTLTLSPAPGALPLVSDTQTIEFTGQSLNWDRAIHSATVVPNRTGPNLYDIHVDVTTLTEYEGELEMSMGLELVSPLGTQTFEPPDDLPYSTGLCIGSVGVGCSTNCAWEIGTGDPIGVCIPWSGGFCNKCHWTSESAYILQGVLLLPGLEYELRLTPGGSGPFTPYLPDSTDEAGSDSITLIGPCDGDLDYNGIVNGFDLALLLGAWGSDDDAADLDSNGIVNGFDLALLLAAWGQCESTGPAV